MTDSGTVSALLGLPFRSRGRRHTVNHSQDKFVRGDVYTNTVERYFSILKRGIYGVYQHVSEARLQWYLTSSISSIQTRIALGIDDVERTELAITAAWGRRLTYCETTRQSRALIS